MNGTTIKILVLVLLVIATPAVAHHSFSAQFDANQPVKLTGTVLEVKWSNPHAWIYINVKDANGKDVKWAFETTAANQLYRQGWRAQDLAASTTVTIQGFRARNGSPTAAANSVILPDGRQLFTGAPSRDSAPR